MSSTQKHTDLPPLPWTVIPSDSGYGEYLIPEIAERHEQAGCDDDDDDLSWIADEDLYVAVLIQQSLNLRPEIIAALKMALRNIPDDEMEYSEGTHGERVYPTDVIRDLLKKMEG
jgi:hypothetical protein